MTPLLLGGSWVRVLHSQRPGLGGGMLIIRCEAKTIHPEAVRTEP